MNHITVMGRLTADPEIKTFNDGTEYCNFSVAVDRGYKAKDGTRPSDFFNCKVTRGGAALLKQYFHKGDGILLEGTMESRKYQDKNGNNATAWELNVNRIEFPIGKKSNGNGSIEDIPLPETEVVEIEGDGELPF